MTINAARRHRSDCVCVFNDLMARRRILFSLVQKTVPQGNRAVMDRVAYSPYLQV